MRFTRLALANFVIPIITGVVVTSWTTSPVCGWFICSYTGLGIFLIVCTLTAIFLDGLVWVYTNRSKFHKPKSKTQTATIKIQLDDIGIESSGVLSLPIWNKEKRDPVICYGILRRVVSADSIDESKSYSGSLAWSSSSSQPNGMRIGAGSCEQLKIVLALENSFTFAYLSNTHRAMGHGQYEIEVVIQGEMNGKRFDEVKGTYIVDLVLSPLGSWIANEHRVYRPVMQMKRKESISNGQSNE